MMTDLTPSQVAALLAKTIPAKLPVLLVGPPGVGKTDVVMQAAKAAGAEILISHPVVSDPTDPKGLPAVVNGAAVWLPYGDLRWAMETKTMLVWFLDDLGQAPPAVQAAYMQLLLSRRCNGHQISDHVVFVAATNRRQDRAGVTSILEPVKSRFFSIINVVPNLDDWINWALENNLPIELIAFLRFRPAFLMNWEPKPDIVNGSCPRTLANVAKSLALDLPDDLAMATIAGAAGEAFAGEFLAFRQIWQSLPDIDQILADPAHAEVPREDQVGTLHALCGALAQKASDQTVTRLTTYAKRLPVEFATTMMLDAARVGGKKFTNTKSWIEWQVRNSEYQV